MAENQKKIETKLARDWGNGSGGADFGRAIAMRKNFTSQPMLLAIFAAMLCPAKAQNASTQLVSAVNELKQQQAQIADNQTKIDSKIADLSRNNSVARIFMSRAGASTNRLNPQNEYILPSLKVLLVVIASLGAIAQAQSPSPIIVQAVNSAATATSAKPAATAADVQSIPEAIKLLERIKARQTMKSWPNRKLLWNGLMSYSKLRAAQDLRPIAAKFAAVYFFFARSCDRGSPC